MALALEEILSSLEASRFYLGVSDDPFPISDVGHGRRDDAEQDQSRQQQDERLSAPGYRSAGRCPNGVNERSFCPRFASSAWLLSLFPTSWRRLHHVRGIPVRGFRYGGFLEPFIEATKNVRPHHARAAGVVCSSRRERRSRKPALAKRAMRCAPLRRRLTPGVVPHSRGPHITGPPSPNGRANERSPPKSAAVLHPECEPAFSP
jgi:hypothetical protein